MLNEIIIKTKYYKKDGWSAETIIDLQDMTREGYVIHTYKDYRKNLNSVIQKIGFPTSSGSKYQAIIPPKETKTLATNAIFKLTEKLIRLQHEQAVTDWIEAIKQGASLESGLNGSHLK